MTASPLYNYSIAPAWDVALISLVNIELITPSGGTPFPPPKAQGLFNPGIMKVRGDGQVYFSGYSSVDWMFDILTRKQFEYLQTTYCGGVGNYSGKVTINTRLGTNAYSRMNAIMILPRPVDVDGSFLWFNKFPVKMTRLGAAA